MKRTVGVIQARMGSHRLPGKMMLRLHGQPVIEWVVRRVRQARQIDDIVVAIPNTPDNDLLSRFVAENLSAIVYRGPEDDVLTRFVCAARQMKATHVVRICADNPLICGSEIDRLIAFYNRNACDYAYNHIPRGNMYPDGLGAEIVSVEILEEINRKAVASSQREHVFNYIWDNSREFRIATCDPLDIELAHPELELDLDTEEDLRKLSKLKINPLMTAREIVAEALNKYKVTL